MIDKQAAPLEETPALDPPPMRKSHKVRNALILAGVAFLIGVTGTAWMLMNSAAVRGFLIDDPAPPQIVRAPAPVLPVLPPALPIAPAGDVEQRIADIEARLALVNRSASRASENAQRAEGLLIAFAARRALDRGLALGYVEGQLSAYFGDTQPRAVAVVIAAARAPVTLDSLKFDLEALSPALTSDDPRASWWENSWHAISALFTVRKMGAPASAPADRFNRAKALVDANRVDSALAEIARLPNREPAAPWMAKAKHYVEANRALDLLEAAAITIEEGPESVPPTPIAPKGETF